ncbi:MAG TPA: multidrug efflux RND transporter permease subunit [Steroidobacteraceae bacterium]|jgi:hydrophobe/amphiphile efflux-1 (HAE1) family protein|nr:multidrug efflux RND transporter permease subunit [Steroidobacteraceae bacterium]
MSISAPFIKRPIATSLLMAGILLVGLVAFPMLPVAPLPQVDFPTLLVSANLPGASPETMASAVATPLEYQFMEIPGVTQLTSQSVLGSTSITVQFDLNRDIDAAAQDIQAAIDAAAGQLPKNLPSPPHYRKENPADSPILIYAVHSDTLPLTTVDDYAENILVQQISRIPGVGQVSLGGQQKPAVRVQVDPAKMANMGIQLTDVASVIQTATVDSAKGAITGTLHSFAIYDNDQLLTAKPWNDVVVAYHNGAPVRIRDIGQAVSGPEDTQAIGYQNGKPGVLLMVFKQPGANVIETARRVEAILPQAMASMPPAIKLSKINDRTVTINASVHDVEYTLMITISLVVLVIFLFLRNVWATIIPGITVPLALFGTCAVMYVLGYSLDNLSLMALTIAVGFVVDDAIVMLENIYRHIEAGMTPMEAALKGAGEIGFTIMSISLSLIAVFIPLLLMSGIVGRLFREFAITVTLTIVVSAFVSLTLSPMMCALFLRDERHIRHGRLYEASERVFQRSLALYERGLDFVLRHQPQTLLVFLLTIVLAGALYVIEPKGFFPQEDTSLIKGLTDGPQDVSFQQMKKSVQKILAVVSKDPGVAASMVFLGGGHPMNNSFTMISLKPRDQRKSSADQIIRRLRKEIANVPGATLFMQSSQDVNVGGRTSRTQYQYTLQDADINELSTWAPKLLAAMKALPQLSDVASDQQTNSTKLEVEIDRDQASRFGIPISQIDQTLYDAYGQAQVAQYFTQLNAYHVILEIPPKLQQDPNSLGELYIRSPLTGEMVPLSTLVKFDTHHSAVLSINHQNQFPCVTLSFNLAPGASLGQAVDAIQKVSDSLRMPPTIQASFQGTAQAFQASLSSEPYLILAAIVVVYIILGMLYESYIHPLTILSTLPSAGVGALLMLMAFHFDLSIIALVGIILLIGIVKKNGIMMVDFAIHAEREEHLSARDSIRKACVLRFRPIMMTTMSALLGALPLMLGRGTGSELRQPLGYTMVGGLLLSQSLTLFTTPVIYLYLDRLNTRLTSWWRGAHHEEAAATPVAAQQHVIEQP